MMNKKEDGTEVIVKGCFTCVVFPIVAVPIYTYTFLCYIWTGYVAMRLWEWFVVPQFGVAELSLKVATGLSMLIALVTLHPNVLKNEISLWKFFLLPLSIPAAMLLFGWLVHTYF